MLRRRHLFNYSVARPQTPHTLNSRDGSHAVGPTASGFWVRSCLSPMPAPPGFARLWPGPTAAVLDRALRVLGLVAAGLVLWWLSPHLPRLRSHSMGLLVRWAVHLSWVGVLKLFGASCSTTWSAKLPRRLFPVGASLCRTAHCHLFTVSLDVGPGRPRSSAASFLALKFF